MSRFTHTAPVLLLAALMLVGCGLGAPEPTATPTPLPTATATATPLPARTALPTILLPVTSTLPPVTLPLPATVVPTVCAPRADWTGEHVIQPGDTLFVIAQRHGLGIREMQVGNCIVDANLIQAGQILRVPGTGETPTPTATATAPPEGSPTPLEFGADHNVLVAGECTFLRWQIDNVDAVFFDGVSVSGRGIREVCPAETTRYTLLVLYPDGEQVPHLVLVEVRPA